MSPRPAEPLLERSSGLGSEAALLRQAARELAYEAAAMISAALGPNAPRMGSAQPVAGSLIEKAPGDWSSGLDEAVEQHLKRCVAQRFPGHAFLGEECHAQAADLGLKSQTVWVVDPIDGSANFIRGYPQYSISIAVVRGGQPLAGCILDPLRGECFSAARGQGADCNGQPLAVASTSELIRALAATVFPKPKAAFMGQYLREFESVLRHCGGVRRSGSMALELAYLAAGRVDIFWERGMGAWDAAAGVLLIQEAGGEVWALDGRPWWESQALAAATPGLRAAWQAQLQGT